MRFFLNHTYNRDIRKMYKAGRSFTSNIVQTLSCKPLPLIMPTETNYIQTSHAAHRHTKSTQNLLRITKHSTMSELTNESSAQAAGTCPQTSTTGQGPGRSMEFLPVFDFEQRPYPNSAEQNHEEDVIDTELRSSIVPVPRPQRYAGEFLDHRYGILLANSNFSRSLSDDYDETPRSWTWAFEKLTKLVTDTRGEATEKVVKFVSK